MAETNAPSFHASDTGQASIEGVSLPDYAIPPIVADVATDTIDASPTAPIEPTAPVKPAMPEEDLDELIIEDFTIDGICGVY